MSINDEELRQTVASFPDWLAADLTDWVRLAESRGARFGSSLDAVRAAIASMNTDGRTPIPSDASLSADAVGMAILRGPDGGAA